MSAARSSAPRARARYPLKDAAGNFYANIPQCTRKDLRNAVEAAAKAGPGWAKRTPYNRGQIIYRLAEMIEARKADMADALMIGGVSKSAAAKEITATIDRLIYYAGWADKYEQVLGNVNPVASPHFNFTVTEPMGIVGLLAPEEAPLLALVSLIAPAITSGNTVVALASTAQPYPAIVLGEMLATSDLPGGVVNLLTGYRKEMVPTFRHPHAPARHRRRGQCRGAQGPQARRRRQREAREAHEGRGADRLVLRPGAESLRTPRHPRVQDHLASHRRMSSSARIILFAITVLRPRVGPFCSTKRKPPVIPVSPTSPPTSASSHRS
jgi:hypothetical protein